MATIIRSRATEPNTLLKEAPAQDREGNAAWFRRQGNPDGIILVGGTSVADFRVRVAQSSLRGDMLPSLWSLCGILVGDGKFASVPLDLRPRDSSAKTDDASAVPQNNAVRVCSLDEYDDAQRYPNVAFVRFAKVHLDAHRDIDRVKSDRSIIDLPTLMLPWLGFVWGTAGATNPLTQGVGLPSAAFVETVFAMASFELTPGLSSASSCPEAIWQSAKWWSDFYGVTAADAKSDDSKDPERRSVGMIPTGAFTIRQKAAAALA
jgi:hypothetical protein